MLKFLSILMLCYAEAAAEAVSGTVLDAATSTGIAGVKVELKQTGTTVYSTTTDALGNFIIDDVKLGGPYDSGGKDHRPCSRRQG